MTVERVVLKGVVIDCADPQETGKNRVHLDFAAADEEATARWIESLGATRRWVSENQDDPFVVLADPEGNEFCVVRSSS